MLNVGDLFRIKTGFKSKHKGKTFRVIRKTLGGALYIEVVSGNGAFFYITTKRSHEWMCRHLEVLEVLNLENE